MHYSSAFLVSLLAATAAAKGFVLPANQEDGVYISKGRPHPHSSKFRRDVSTTVKIGNITYDEVTEPGAIEKRGVPWTAVRCDDRNILNEWDYAPARDNLKKSCDKGNKAPAWDGKSGILYARVGSAIWYVCSWGGENPCSTDEINDAEVKMDAECTDEVSAWIEVSNWKKGYGRAISGMEVCDQRP
ncbi:uncharacterized protein E0L32_007569 [Thyridium curvatum]|uniref:Uncharacterized protein n=1 Tax=Thyridium curvatum TaxID=1093900 RepID=A0A507APG1_9PEZI|nr:uncharacterized protein E0L32_007569 [Thyridium curvatum]TPX11832.1 hypothetical protein E0L32_007569 [Thyridium curvatum]